MSLLLTAAHSSFTTITSLCSFLQLEESQREKHEMELQLAQPPPRVEDDEHDDDNTDRSHDMNNMEDLQNLQSEEDRITQAEKDKRLQQQLLVSEEIAFW